MRIENAKVRLPNTDESRSIKKLRTSVYTEDYRGEYYNVKVNQLIPFKNQSRKYFDQQSIENLAKTIKEHGIRQPLTVIPSEEDGLYEIVSGERRYRAAKLLNLEVVPCIIFHDKKKAEEIAIIENIQREDLHPVELMKAYSNLLKHEICFSMQEIANKLGVAKSSVVEIINLKLLSGEVQEIILSNKIVNRDFFRILCKVSPDEQLRLVNNFLVNATSIKLDQPKLKKTKLIIISSLDGKLLFEGKNTKTLSSEEKVELKKLLLGIIQDL